MVTGMGRKKRAREHRSVRAWERHFAPLRRCAFLPLLFLLPTVLLWSVTVGGKTLVPADLLMVMSPWRHFAQERFPDFERVKAPLLDVVQQYHPWRKFYADTIKQGELPLWNPFMFCGTPFVGNGMSAVFYPLNLLFVAMPVELAFGWCAWLHLVLAGVFMFGFLRRFVSSVSALTGAIAFQICGFFVAWLAYLPLLCTAVWLPAALWAYEHSGEKPFVPTTVLAAAALGMALLAGHPQIAFYVLWAFGTYAVLRSLVTLSLRHLVTASLCLLGGIALGAAQLLPLLEMAKLSQRSGAEVMEAASGNRLFIDQFVRLFVPAFFGDWRSGTHFFWDFARFNFVERTGYPGVIAFLLAGIGIAGAWGVGRGTGDRESQRPGKNEADTSHPAPSTSHLQWLALAGGVFATFGLLAASLPLVHRFMALGLPFTQAFVGISRALFLFDFGVAMLCGVGMETLREGNRPHLLWLAVPMLMMAACVSYGVSHHADIAFQIPLRDFTLGQLYRWLTLTTLGIVTIAAIQFAKSSPSHSPQRFMSHALPLTHYDLRFTPYALPFLIAADLLFFAWGQHPEAERGMVFFETPSIRWLKKHIGSQRFIAVGTDALRNWTPSNTLMVYRLRDAKGSDSLMTGRFNRFARAWDERAFSVPFAVRNFQSPLLDLMAVRFIVAAVPLPSDESKGLRVIHESDLWVYKNPDALPRAFAVTAWQWATSPEDALRQVTRPAFDPRRTVILERLSGSPSLVPRPPSRTNRLFVPASCHDAINRLEVTVRLPQSAVIVLSDSAYPGWRSFRKRGDGSWQPLPLFIADYAFRAVLLSEGNWQVSWIFFPSSIAVGLFLSLLSWNAIMAAFAWSIGDLRGKVISRGRGDEASTAPKGSYRLGGRFA